MQCSKDTYMTIDYYREVRPCIDGLALLYLLELCCSTTQVQRRGCLRSAVQAELIVPRSRNATKQRRAFSVAWPCDVEWPSYHSSPNICSALHLLPLCPQDRYV